jgi:hypothetical protein
MHGAEALLHERSSEHLAKLENFGNVWDQVVPTDEQWGFDPNSAFDSVVCPGGLITEKMGPREKIIPWVKGIETVLDEETMGVPFNLVPIPDFVQLDDDENHIVWADEVEESMVSSTMPLPLASRSSRGGDKATFAPSSQRKGRHPAPMAPAHANSSQRIRKDRTNQLRNFSSAAPSVHSGFVSTASRHSGPILDSIPKEMPACSAFGALLSPSFSPIFTLFLLLSIARSSQGRSFFKHFVEENSIEAAHQAALAAFFEVIPLLHLPFYMILMPV